ncbi:DUF3025 domain-containing protein [Chitinolyticbacter meiyuanensis]|uniref:DUF3025 domain-containing protein n=1 Tax=Chitinolyticbacter meiyuanensis TaxID=682798 RepID=UPI0011E5EB41|nr:DUF3025 domain-containing protein [Chitinolyticbacter meiyuanensis]
MPGIAGQHWPDALAHPAFALLAPLTAQLPRVPALADWQRLPPVHTQSGLPLQCVDPSSLSRYYEAEIYELGRIATRDDWHDCFNALVWHSYPRSKAALNALHYRLLPDTGQGPRGPVRDAATLFDECGLIVPYSDPALLELLVGHEWSTLFVDRRDDWGRHIDALVFGHATFENLLAPFTGLTGKCWPVQVEPAFFALPLAARMAQLDSQVCTSLSAGWLTTPRQLPPLPYLGIPGWWPQQDASFYANHSYFRSRRR